MQSGTSGWASQSTEPDWAPARDGGYRYDIRRWPAAIRLLGRENQDRAPRVAEDDMYQFLRQALTPKHKRNLCENLRPEFMGPFRAWVAETTPLASWWRSSESWRAHRETAWYRNREESGNWPHLEPSEWAQFRIPDDIALDADVIAFTAWCQGVSFERMRKVGEKAPDVACLNGLAKVHESPWVALAIAAPLMQPVGIQLPGLSYLDSGLRLQAILKQPYTATDEELGPILASDGFLVAYDRARVARRQGGVINPPGHWFAGGRGDQRPLGVGFGIGGKRVYAKSSYNGPVDAYDASSGHLVRSYETLDQAAEHRRTQRERIMKAIQRGHVLLGCIWRMG